MLTGLSTYFSCNDDDVGMQLNENQFGIKVSNNNNEGNIEINFLVRAYKVDSRMEWREEALVVVTVVAIIHSNNWEDLLAQPFQSQPILRAASNK